MDRESAPRLVELLQLEASERGVLSVIYDTATSEPELRHASLLFGPPEMASSTWAAWHERRVERVASLPGRDALPGSFAHEDRDVMIGRVEVSAEVARQVLGECLDGDVPSVGPLPRARCALAPPDAQIRVFPHLATPAGQLAFAAGRPLRGFLFPSEREGRDLAPSFENGWTIDGNHVHAPDLWHVGIATGASGINPAPGGLLLGRVERRAWLRDLRGADDDYSLYLIRVGFDPARISPYELVVELQEWIGGEFAVARRLPLEWLDLSAWAGEDHVDLLLPMMGRGARRSVSLYDLGGELIDISDPVALVETIHMSMNLIGPGGATSSQSFTVGEKIDPTLGERLDRLETIDAQVRDLIAEGLPNRVVVRGAQAVDLLRQRLTAARGELRVMDRYFGGKRTDWMIFDKIAIPVRVLITNPGSMPPERPGLQVKQWQQPSKGVTPPFHDRLYLWEGGGLSVGTSASHLGSSDFRIDSLDPSEAAMWSARFETYWNSPAFDSV